MILVRCLMAITACLILCAPATYAQNLPQTQDAFMDKAITASPAADQWSIYGTGETHTMVRDDTVKGGWAFTVTIAGKSENPWDVESGVVTDKPVRKGDVLLLAFWARALKTPDGDTAIHAPCVIQVNHAPYTRMGDEMLNIGPEWKLYYVSGAAGQDMGPGETGAGIHLATGHQSIALGPVFMLNFGAGYDRSKLPHN